MKPSTMASQARSIGLAARLLSAALILCFLYWAKIVLIPLALALLISFMLRPVVKRLRSWHVPRMAAVLGTVGLFMAVVGGLGWIIGGQLVSFGGELPTYRANIVKKIEAARAMTRGGTLEKIQATIDSVTKEVSAAQEQSANPAAPSEAKPIPVTITKKPGLVDMESFAALGPLVEPVSTLGLVMLLVVLMLLQWADLRSRLMGFLNNNMTGTSQALDDAGRRVGRYLGMQLLYNSGFGLVAGLGLWAIGVPYAALWGLCAALFRYVPYAGPVVAAALPLLVSLVTSDGWSQVMMVGGLFLLLELVSNNAIEPWLYGSNLGISEMGIIMATVAWTFLWGPAGLVLATPMTVCLVVMGTHVPALSFFARLLGDKDLLDPHHQLYQRLLAKDKVEAMELVKNYAREHDASAFVEHMALPTLAQAARDVDEGRLRPAAAQSITAQISALAQLARTVEIESAKTVGEALGPSPAFTLAPVPVKIWSIDPFADAAVPFLQEELADAPAELRLASSREMAGEIFQRIDRARPPVAVCFVQMHGEDSSRVRGLIKRLRALWPQVPLMVARWGGSPFDAEEKQALAAAGANAFASTLEESRAWIASHALNHARAHAGENEEKESAAFHAET